MIRRFGFSLIAGLFYRQNLFPVQRVTQSTLISLHWHIACGCHLASSRKKENTMAGKILVFLKRRDRVEQILPCLEKFARPGMRVILLIPYPQELWLWVRDYSVVTESPWEAIQAGKKIVEGCSGELQKRLAEQRFLPACEALRKKGIDVEIDLYTSSLRRVVHDSAANREVHLIMIRAWIRYLLGRFWMKMIRLSGSLGRSTPAPVLLVHTNEQG